MFDDDASSLRAELVGVFRCGERQGERCLDRRDRRRSWPHLRRFAVTVLAYVVERLFTAAGDRWTLGAGLLADRSLDDLPDRWQHLDDARVVLTYAAGVAEAVEQVVAIVAETYLDLSASQEAAQRLRGTLALAADAAEKLAAGMPADARLRCGAPLPGRPSPEAEAREAVDTADLDRLNVLLRRRRRAAEAQAGPAIRPWWRVTYDPDVGDVQAVGPQGEQLQGRTPCRPPPKTCSDASIRQGRRSESLARPYPSNSSSSRRPVDAPHTRQSGPEADARQRLLAGTRSARDSFSEAAQHPARRRGRRVPVHSRRTAADICSTTAGTGPGTAPGRARRAAAVRGWLWIRSETVVTTPAAPEWGRFGSHRPQRPAQLARRLLSDRTFTPHLNRPSPISTIRSC